MRWQFYTGLLWEFYPWAIYARSVLTWSCTKFAISCRKNPCFKHQKCPLTIRVKWLIWTAIYICWWLDSNWGYTEYRMIIKMVIRLDHLPQNVPSVLVLREVKAVLITNQSWRSGRAGQQFAGVRIRSDVPTVTSVVTAHHTHRWIFWTQS